MGFGGDNHDHYYGLIKGQSPYNWGCLKQIIVFIIIIILFGITIALLGN